MRDGPSHRRRHSQPRRVSVLGVGATNVLASPGLTGLSRVVEKVFARGLQLICLA